MKFLFPGKCEICKKNLSGSESDLCRICFERLKNEALDFPVRCPACLDLKPLLADGICSDCQIDDNLGWRGECLARYREPWSSLIRSVKFSYKASLMDSLGELLVACLNPPQADELITWVPLGSRRFAIRGFNQAARLAKAYAKGFGLTAGPLLGRVKSTAAQARLAARGRKSNIRHAFKVLAGAEIVGRQIVLIDDVVTTGGTTQACCQALFAGGAESVRIVSLCCG